MNNIEEHAKELLSKISTKVEEVTGVTPSRVSKSDKLKRWSAFIRVESPREEFLWSEGYPDEHGVSAIRIGTWVSHSSSDQQDVYDALETMLTNQFPEHTVDRNEKGIALEIKLNTKADSQKLDENLLKITHGIQDLIPTFYELIDGKIVFNRRSDNGQIITQKETNVHQLTEENYDWSYETKGSKEEFLDWLKEFELPGDDFDYILTYKRIYDDFNRLFDWNETEHFESTYLDVIHLNIGLIEEGVNEWYNNLDDSAKEFCAEEGYEDDPLGAMTTLALEFGGGSISSYDFIKNFDRLEQQRIVLGLYVASLVKYLWSDMGNDWDSAPSYWEGYQIKKDDW
jgi:hypothetical protein